jgi:hypothetical protein
MHAQGKYAGSKAAGSSLKDVLYGGPPVVNPVSNPNSYGQHNGQHNNYGELGYAIGPLGVQHPCSHLSCLVAPAPCSHLPFEDLFQPRLRIYVPGVMDVPAQSR